MLLISKSERHHTTEILHSGKKKKKIATAQIQTNNINHEVKCEEKSLCFWIDSLKKNGFLQYKVFSQNSLFF